jgi:hypothetical protein
VVLFPQHQGRYWLEEPSADVVRPYAFGSQFLGLWSEGRTDQECGLFTSAWPLSSVSRHMSALLSVGGHSEGWAQGYILLQGSKELAIEVSILTICGRADTPDV